MLSEVQMRIGDKTPSIDDLIAQLEVSFDGWRSETMETIRMELIEEAHDALGCILASGKGVRSMPFTEVNRTIRLLKSLIWALGHSPGIIRPDTRER